MSPDFTTYQFQPGNTYRVSIEPGVDAVKLTHHGEGAIEPQDRYAMLEFKSNVGDGPWREFRDWETETDVTINSHHMTEVGESTRD